ncbi:MAG TPA: acyl-CoA thioesterase [Bacillales bacterium]|nr:acyl-CoA thioesterase [Bacillales bacterium]
MVEQRFMKESRTVKTSHVLPPDTNHHGTIFGGKLMAHIDDVASIAATKHARNPVVTASTDSLDFLHPIKEGHAVCLEAFVTWTGQTSMEVFVKVIAEDLLSGERQICAVSFLTFVAMKQDGKPTPVPGVVPVTEEEKWLHNTAEERAKHRKERRRSSAELAKHFSVKEPWE